MSIVDKRNVIRYHRGGSGIKEVVRLTIVEHCGRRCPEVLCVLAEARKKNFTYIFSNEEALS